MARSCSSCGQNIFYRYDSSFYRARKENRVCIECRNKLYPLNQNIGKHLSNETKRKISDALKGIPSWNLGIPTSSDTKRKISIAMMGRASWSKGKTFSKEYVKKLQDSHIGQISPMKGRHHTDVARSKIRKAILEDLKLKGISHRSNPVACQFINNLNIIRNWNLQHAGNGGEVIIDGYLLDGYDKNKNIVFEYDEPQHHLTSKKKKDIQRQNDIFKYFDAIGKSISFWRYDERYKNLYEVYPL
jgi:hypothetical protein